MVDRSSPDFPTTAFTPCQCLKNKQKHTKAFNEKSARQQAITSNYCINNSALIDDTIHVSCRGKTLVFPDIGLPLAPNRVQLPADLIQPQGQVLAVSPPGSSLKASSPARRRGLGGGSLMAGRTVSNCSRSVLLDGGEESISLRSAASLRWLRAARAMHSSPKRALLAVRPSKSEPRKLGPHSLRSPIDFPHLGTCRTVTQASTDTPLQARHR